jgi:hypothetical protein
VCEKEHFKFRFTVHQPWSKERTTTRPANDYADDLAAGNIVVVRCDLSRPI